MKTQPSVAILGGMGINCENESAFAFEQAGAKTTFVHVNDLIKNKNRLDDFQILFFPGGFSFGDHTGAGKALAQKLKNHIQEPLKKFFFQRDTLGIGVCNGFQVMTSLGILPGFSADEIGDPQVALMKNDSNNYQCEWVTCQAVSSQSVFTRQIDTIELPIAHGEGNFFAKKEIIKKLEDKDCIALKYTQNINGSQANIAGICDPSGRILGMMPHPERFLFAHNHPLFSNTKERAIREKKPIPQTGAGRIFFQNAVDYFQ